MNGRCTPAVERAFLRSVYYAAVFDYPVTVEQLHQAFIGVRATPGDIERWFAQSAVLQHLIERCDGYFFPRGRRDLLDLRHAREVISRRVLEDLHRPLSMVLRMPFVRMVALSGSLAHLNADGEADLDLFVITKPHRVWSVTTTLLMLARLFGTRRQLCLNYVISEAQLSVEPEDLFSANQIVHLRPLSGGDVYRRFLETNSFVSRFYPNFVARPVAFDMPIRRALERALDWTIAPLHERLCRIGYRWHLLRKAPSWQSHDQVRLDAECLKLHTHSHRQGVMERFEMTVAEAELTLEAAFPARAGL